MQKLEMNKMIREGKLYKICKLFKTNVSDKNVQITKSQWKSKRKTYEK